MTPREPLQGLDEIYRQRLEAFVEQVSRELRVAEGYPDVQAQLRVQQERARKALEQLKSRQENTEHS